MRSKQWLLLAAAITAFVAAWLNSDDSRRDTQPTFPSPDAVRRSFTQAPRALSKPLPSAPPTAPTKPERALSNDNIPTPSALLDAAAPLSLNREGLQQAIRATMPELEHCYEEWLKLQPTLTRRMQINLTIDTDDGVQGRIVKAFIPDAGADTFAFDSCVLSAFSELHFEPPLSGPLHMSYPLAFTAPPTASAEVRLELARLCERMHTEATKPEHARIAPEDLLTVVIANLERQTPALQPYFAELLQNDVPPPQRKVTFTRGLSSALGHPWLCPTFDTLWNGERL